jgi:hypothetical protein
MKTRIAPARFLCVAVPALGFFLAALVPGQLHGRKAQPSSGWSAGTVRLALGPPIYRGTLKSKGRTKCVRGCPAVCKTLKLGKAGYQLHCKSKKYGGLVIFSGKRCKKTGKRIYCWLKNKRMTFRGSR